MAISDGIKKKLDRYKGTSQTQDKTQSNSALAKLNQYKRDNTEANYNRAMEEYNAIATEQKKTHDEYMSYDADAGKNELDNLAKVMENYNARNKMSVGGVDRGLADNVIKQAGYENYSDFEKDYYTKKNYYNEAAAYQIAARLEESLKKLDEMDKTEYGNLAEQGKLNYAQEAVDRKNQRNGFQNKVLDPILNAMGVRDPQNVNWSWSEEELNTYFALRETDSQAADTYFRYLKEKDNQAKIDATYANLGLDLEYQLGGEEALNAVKTISSVPLSLLGVVDLFGDALQYMAYGDIGDTSITGAGYAADKWQQESAERLAEETAGTAWDLASKAPILAKMTGIDNLAVALQSTGLSMAQSYAFMQTMGAAGTVFLAGSAGSNALRESLESGDSPEVAMGYGIASGIFEGVFEYISLEKVLKPKDSNGWKTLIKNLFKSAVAEGSEEVWTEISDKIADICLRKDNSEWALAKAEYYATHSDASAANAEFYAFRKAFGDVNAAFIGGFASGGIMGGASSSMAQMKKISDANTVVGNYAENKSGLVNMIKETAATTGQNYADNLTEESSDKDIRNAVIESQKSISNDAIARRLAELDVDSDTALATADAIRKNAMDFYLTSEEKELLKTAEAKQVASEYSSGSGWTSELNATLEAFSYPSKTAVGDINDVYTNENTPKAEIKPVEDATPLTDEQKRFLTDIGRTDMIAQNEADVDSVTAEDSIRSFAKANDINADDLIAEFSSLKETRPYLTSTAYLNALDLAETYGKLGASYSDTVKNVGFKSEQMGKAYNAGIENYKPTRTDAYKEAEKRKKGFAPFDGKSHLATEQELSAAAIYGGEAITDAESLSDETKAQMGFWQEFYKGTSVTVAFFRGSGREGDANGGYHKQSNTVFIDVNDDIIRNGLHEYVHTMSENAPKLYDELKEFVVGTLFDGSNESFVNEVERKYASYNSILKEQWLKTHDDLAGYKEYSREKCAEEVIAESTKTAFDDIDKVVDFAENHKGLFNRLLGFFKKMANILKSAIAKYGTTNKFAEALARDEQAVNRVIDIMMRAREGMMVTPTASPALDSTDAKLAKMSEAKVAEQIVSKAGGVAPDLPMDSGKMDENGNITMLSVNSAIEAGGMKWESEIVNGKEFLIIKTANGNAITKDTKIPAIVSVLRNQKSPLNILLDVAQDKLNTIGEADRNAIYNAMAQFYHSAIVYGTDAKQGKEKLDAIWKWVGTDVFRAIKPNSDKQYGVSNDLQTVCKKTEALLDSISNYQVSVRRGTTPAEVMRLYLKTGEERYQTPCPFCYVFSHWIRMGLLYETAASAEDYYKDHLTPEGLKDVEYWKKEYLERKAWAKKNESTIAKAKQDMQDALDIIDEFSNLLSEAIKQNNTDAANRIKSIIDTLNDRYIKAYQLVQLSDYAGWISNCILNVDDEKKTYTAYNDYKIVDRDILFDFRRSDELVRDYPALARFRTSKGSAGGKAVENYADNKFGEVVAGVATGGDRSARNTILDAFNGLADNKAVEAQIASAVEKVRRQNLRGGQRFFSWSDNRVDTGVDMLLNFIQFACLGSAVQSYTKQIEGLEFISSMGGYVNASLVGKGVGFKNPKYDANGKIIGGELVFSNIQGINAETTFELNKRYDKAGNILVGMNDTHIAIALNDERIFFVIPWHRSGLSNNLLFKMMAMTGEEYVSEGGDESSSATDYTPYQEEKLNAKHLNGSKEEYKAPSKPLTDLFKKIETMDVHGYKATSIRGFDKIKVEEGAISDSQWAYRKLRAKIMNGGHLTVEEEVAVNGDWYLSNIRKSMIDNKIRKWTTDDIDSIYPYEYWDVNSTYENAYVNNIRYLEYCRRLGVQPKFCGITNTGEVKSVKHGDFTDQDGYWKVLVDRRMYDITGKYQGLTPVSLTNVKKTQPGYLHELITPEGLESRKAEYAKKGLKYEVTAKADVEGSARIAKAVADDMGGLLTLDRVFDKEQALANYKAVISNRKNLKEYFGEGNSYLNKEKAKLNKELGTNYSFIGRTATDGTDTDAEVKYWDLMRRMSEDSDLDDETIRKYYGWFKGYDGRWRYEIDDSKATINESLLTGKRTEVKLGEFFKHPELYKYYPDLANVDVIIHRMRGDVVGRAYENTIEVDAKQPVREIKSTLLHEIQHHIQRIEGFAKGGRSGMFTDHKIPKKYQFTEVVLYSQASTLTNTINAHIEDVKNKIGIEDLAGYLRYHEKDVKQIFKTDQKFKDTLKRYLETKAELQPYSDNTAYGQYQRLAGEIESRDVSARMDLNNRQRKANRPDIDREDAITRYSLKDSEYLSLAKDPEKNREALQKMVFQKAMQSGYTELLYHGTPGLKSTILDAKYSDDGISFFMSDDEETVEFYSRSQNYKDIRKNITENGANNYAFYANTSKMYVIEGNGSDWNNLIDLTPLKSMDDFEREFPESDGYEIEETDDYIEVRNGRRWGTYYWDDANGIYTFGDGTEMRDEGRFGSGSTRDISKQVYDSGEYSGVIFKNIADSGRNNVSNIYNFFHPERDVKSADPVTYDDSGNIIPLSERFNPANDDIRYSLKDSEGNSLTKAQENYFKDSEIRDEDGNLLVVYHGTDADFTVFDKTKGRSNMDIQGMFFSPWKIDASGYGSNVKAYYLNITNPASESIAYKALNKFKGQNGAGIKAREYLESLGYDGVNNGNEEYIAFDSNQIKEISNKNPTKSDDTRYSLRGNGYDGYSMSNNARDAYENGQKPWSAWKKRELLEAVKKINPSRYELASKMSVDELKKTILSSRGWHHTSKFYNKTTFYEVTEETVAHIGYHIDYELSRSGTFRDDNGYHELWYSDSNATYNQNARKWEYDGEPIPLYNDYVVHYSLREAKQGYVDARNRENAEIKTLTQEQHNALADLARIRHEFHSSIESYWNTESNADWTIFDTDGKINTLLRNANLPTIDFGDYTDVPTSDDYYYVLDESEREMYSDPQDWKERSGAYLEFSDRMAQINDIIESYLRAVDKEHGTSYAPTGFARLAYSLRDTITDRELLAEALDSHITNAEDRKTLAKYKMSYNESLKRADTIASLKSQLANETDANRQAVLKKQINEQQNELNKRNAELKSILTMPRMIAIVKDMREEVARYQWALQEADDNLLKEQIKNGRLSVKLQAQIKAKEDKYQRYKNNTIERRGINYYRPRIEKSYNELVKMATDKSKKYPLADAFKEPIMNIISALNFVKTGSETNKAARLLTAQQALNKLAQETASTEKFLEKYGHLLPEDMPEWIRTVSGYLSEAYEFIGPVNVANMNSEQLASLYHLLKTVEMTAKQASKSYTSKAVDMSDVAKETMLYTDSLAKDKDLPRILRGVRNFMTWQNAQPITVFERMGEGGEKIFKLLSNGQSKLAFNTKDIENKVAELKDKYGITDKQIRGWYKDEIEITIGGDEMTVPTAFIAELHCLLKDEDAYRHVISGGGIQLADIEHTTKVNKDIAPHKMAELEIADIESKLNPDVRAFIDEMHKYLADKGAEWGNEVSVARYGFEAFGIKNYYPIKTIRSLENDAKMKEENPNNIYGLLNKSFTKERHFNAKNAIVIGNFFETFAKHMGEMATYNAYALPVLDTVRWLNHKQSSYDADGKPTETSVQQSLRGAYGNEIVDYINKLLTSINGTHSSDTSGFLAYLRMTNRVAVAANIRVAIQQPLSIVRAFDEINPKYVSIPSNLKETYAEMIEHSGIALWKDMGYYDTNVSRSLTSKLYAEDGYKGTMDKVTEKTMVLAEKGDQFTWAILWNACKNEAAEKALEGDAYWKAVTERFESIIYHTQVVDSMLTRSQWMRGNEWYHRITSSFKAEPTTTYNALLRLVDKFDRAARTSNIQEAWAKTKGAFLRTVAVVGLSAIVQAIATAAIDMLRDDDDYETPFEKWWAAFVSNLGDNTLVVGSIPVVSDLVDVFKGYDSSRPDTEWLSNVINLAKRIANAIKNNSWDAKTTYKLVQAASEISGFPIANAMRDLVGIWNHVIGTIDSSLKIQFSPEPNSLGYENYYKAYTEGKMARAEEIIVEMESNNISEQAMWNGLVGKMREDYRAGNKSAEEAREYLATTAALIGIERTDKQITKLIEGW